MVEKSILLAMAIDVTICVFLLFYLDFVSAEYKKQEHDTTFAIRWIINILIVSMAWSVFYYYTIAYHEVYN